MDAIIKQQIWRYARGITVLGCSILGVAMIAQAVQRSSQGSIQVGHETHDRGQYMFSDIPWTLAPAHAASGEETIESPTGTAPFTPTSTTTKDIYHCFVVDPKFRNFFAYRGATVFKPNRRELESALGAAVDLDHPAALPTTFSRLGVDHLLLTLGERGMALVSADGIVHRVPTTAREVYDVVGAGDTVTAYLATMLAAGASALEAAIVANYAAGVEVGKLGAATVSAAEVLDAFDRHLAET